MNTAQRKQALDLAREILDGIEDANLPPERSLLKASRLARLMRDDDAETWLALERDGYNATTARECPSFFASCRAYEGDGNDVYQGVPVLAQRSGVLRTQMETLRPPSVSGEYASIALRETRRDIALVARTIQQFDSVLGAVEKRVHAYAVRVYHMLSFASAAEGIFDAAKESIEPLLLATDADLVKKLDYAALNLIDDDPESVSAAMNSLRRLLSAFADAVFPPNDEPRVMEGDGRTVQLGSAQYLNRIKAFIEDNCPSGSRSRGLKQSVSHVNDRLSAGVHDAVTRAEARFLLLKTYVTLGEILDLRG